MADAPLRDEFPILATKTFLNTCSLGALSRRVEARVAEFHSEWRGQGAAAWFGPWLERLHATRETFARLVGADASEVAILPNVSSALNALASAFDPAGRPNVVTSRLDFPTVAYAWAQRPGVRLRAVGEKGAVEVPVAEFERHLDESVRAAATSHVNYTTGAIADVAALAAHARRAGALSIIDSYHGVGQLPVDVHELGCDALVTGGLKWLLGGPGCGLLYVRRGVLDRLAPTLAGWFGNEHQFEFDPEAFAFRPGAARFELGTPSLPSAFATLAGMEIIEEVGPDRIRKRQNLLGTDLYEKLVDHGYPVRSPAEESRRAGILLVEVDEAPAVVARLAARDILVDARDGGVRVSPFFYNTLTDNDRFLEALVELAPPPRLEDAAR